MQRFSTTSLEDLLNPPLQEIPEDKKCGNPKEFTSFQKALECIYSPLYEQVNINDDFEKIMDPAELTNVVLRAFPMFKDQYEGVWSNITMNLDSTDYCLESIRQQEYWIDCDMLPGYNQCDFESRDDFLLWKRQMKLAIKNTVDLACKFRKRPEFYYFKFFIENLVWCDFIKNKYSSVYVTILNWRSIDFSVFDNPDLACQVGMEKWQDVNIEFWAHSFFGFTKIGSVQIDLATLMRRIAPKNNLWGKASLRESYDIMDHAKRVGTISINLKFAFQHFLKASSKVKPKDNKLVNFLDMYEIIVQKILARNKVGHTMFTYQEQWILLEFSKVFSVGDVFKSLSHLRGLEGRIDLLASKPFVKELSQCIEFIHMNQKEKYSVSTLTEREMFNATVLTLEKKIAAILWDFINYFPDNSPIGIFSLLLESHKLLYVQYLKRGKYPDMIQQFCTSSIQKDYQELKNEMKFEGDVLNATSFLYLCENLKLRIQNIAVWKDSLDGYLDTTSTFIQQYYDVFSDDILKFAKMEIRDQALPMIQLCTSIVQLHIIIDNKFKIKRKIDPFKMGKKYIEEYVDQIKQQVELWIDKAITFDKFLPIQNVRFSSSMVDVFESISQTFDYLKTLDFVYDKSLIHILYILGVEYAKRIQALCVQDMVQTTDFTQNICFFTRMNNVAFSIQEIDVLKKDILGDDYCEADEADNLDEYYSKQMMNSILDEMVTIMCQKLKISAVMKNYPKETTEEVIEEFLWENLFDKFLTKILGVFNTNLEPFLFQKVLEKILVSIIKGIDEALLKNHFSIDQIRSLEFIISPLEKYFYGAGKGLEKKVITSHLLYFEEILHLVSLKTSTLCELLKDGKSFMTVEREHLLYFLSLRDDKEARDLIKLQTSKIKETILNSHKCFDANLLFGTLYICTDTLVWHPTFKPKIVIPFEEIKEIKKITNLTGKGIVFTCRDRVLRLYNKKASNRDHTFDEIGKRTTTVVKNRESIEPSVKPHSIQDILGIPESEEILYKDIAYIGDVSGDLFVFTSYFALVSKETMIFSFDDFIARAVGEVLSLDFSLDSIRIHVKNAKKIVEIIQQRKNLTWDSELRYQLCFGVTDTLMKLWPCVSIKQNGVLYIGSTHLCFETCNFANRKVNFQILLSDIISYKEKRNFYKTWLVVTTKNHEFKFRMKFVKDAMQLLKNIIN